MQAQARAIGPRRGPRFQAQVPAGPRVSAEINQRVRCAKNSSQIQLSATTRPCRPSRASEDPQRHAIEQMPRRGREGRRRHIGGGPGVGPGGRVRRSRSTSITLVVVVARILGRVELATSSRICGHSRRWRDCGITYGGRARIRDGSRPRHRSSRCIQRPRSPPRTRSRSWSLFGEL